MNFVQHISNNGVLGAPANTPIDVCRALPVTNIVYLEDNTHAVVSYWQPDAEEKERIANGLPIRVTILGPTHAPIKLGVDGDGEIG
jgi:hypothetical protein